MISRRLFLETIAATTAGIWAGTGPAGNFLAQGIPELASGFGNPPDTARPWVYWIWINGNLTREGITADLEAMQRVGIGGVLEPANAVPVVIEDGAFIGSRCMIVDGARVGKGSVLGAGTILNPSIPVIDAATGEEVSRGHVPDYCVAVTANRRREYPGGEFFLPCVLIIKRMEQGETHDKVALNSLLREHGVAT